MRHLLSNNGFYVFFVQLLPIANIKLAKFHNKINTFNFWIRSLKQKRGVTIVSLESIFIDPKTGNLNLNKLCSTIKNHSDYLHPNDLGLHDMQLALQGV